MQLACFFSQQYVSPQKTNTFFVDVINFKIFQNGTSKTFDGNFYLNQHKLTLFLIDLIKAVYLNHVCIFIYHA